MTTNKLRGTINKKGTTITINIDVKDIDWRNPVNVSSKGNASYIYSNKYELEVADQDGITVPLTVSAGLYMDSKNWKEYQEQVQGTTEGKALGTNEYTIDKELFNEFLAFKKFMEASKK